MLAEKISTAIALGEANTRVRDYADICTLTGKYPLASAAMRAALRATAGYRQVTLVSLSSVIGALPTTRQAAYHAFRRRLGADGSHLPADLSEVIAAVVAFVDPLVNSQAEPLTWQPTTRHWH